MHQPHMCTNSYFFFCCLNFSPSFWRFHQLNKTTHSSVFLFISIHLLLLHIICFAILSCWSPFYLQSTFIQHPFSFYCFSWHTQFSLPYNWGSRSIKQCLVLLKNNIHSSQQSIYPLFFFFAYLHIFPSLGKGVRGIRSHALYIHSYAQYFPP